MSGQKQTMTVEMTTRYAEYENHKREAFETSGTITNVCGTDCLWLEGYGYFAHDGLRVVGEEVERC